MLERNEMLYPVEVDEQKNYDFRLPAAYKTWEWKSHTYPEDSRYTSRANFETWIEEEGQHDRAPWDMIEDPAEQLVWKAYFLTAFGDVEAETWDGRKALNEWEKSYTEDAMLFKAKGGNANFRGLMDPAPGDPHGGNFQKQDEFWQDKYWTPNGLWKPEGADELDGVELRKEPEVIFEPTCRPIARRHGYADVCGERGTCNCAEAKEAFEASDYTGKK